MRAAIKLFPYGESPAHIEAETRPGTFAGQQITEIVVYGSSGGGLSVHLPDEERHTLIAFLQSIPDREQ